MRDEIAIANMSGFFGDRLSAAEEMVGGGPIDVLTGDYLAELTMAILARQRAKDPRAGFVPTFLEQMERVMSACIAKGIRVVVNAGGLNPEGLARALESLAARLGLAPKIAWISGDDLVPALAKLRAAGERLAHLDTGAPLDEASGQLVSANAYLGGWGIREALARGADIVVCPRVTDAALVVGPAAWAFDWRRDDWDALAGAVVAGHVIECGAQACGGNYSFFEEVPRWTRIGFPIARVRRDGSFVVTKHPGTGGLVSVGTVTAQLLYEIQGARYVNPDVVARFDGLSLREDGPDRVLVTGARGEPPPRTLKVSVNRFTGYRNTMTALVSGTDVEAKARIAEDIVVDAIGGRDAVARFEAHLDRSDRPDPHTNEEAIARLRFVAFDADAARVGRAFSSRIVETALANVPGFTLTSPPRDATPCFVFWPATIDRRHVEEVVHFAGESIAVPPPPLPLDTQRASDAHDAVAMSTHEAEGASELTPWTDTGATIRAPLGRLFGARSGDKGGDASLGVWAKTPDAYRFLRAYLTTEKLRALLPETAALAVSRVELANLLAIHFVIRGLLGEGALASSRTDPQAKTLGEWLRARVVELPASLLRTD